MEKYALFAKTGMLVKLPAQTMYDAKELDMTTDIRLIDAELLLVPAKSSQCRLLKFSI